MTHRRHPHRTLVPQPSLHLLLPTLRPAALPLPRNRRRSGVHTTLSPIPHTSLTGLQARWRLLGERRRKKTCGRMGRGRGSSACQSTGVSTRLGSALPRSSSFFFHVFFHMGTFVCVLQQQKQQQLTAIGSDDTHGGQQNGRHATLPRQPFASDKILVFKTSTFFHIDTACLLA